MLQVLVIPRNLAQHVITGILYCKINLGLGDYNLYIGQTYHIRKSEDHRLNCFPVLNYDCFFFSKQLFIFYEKLIVVIGCYAIPSVMLPYLVF